MIYIILINLNIGLAYIKVAINIYMSILVWIGFPGRLGMRPENRLIELKTSN
jgi:hypothetical protein